jgi:hypothetical protein
MQIIVQIGTFATFIGFVLAIAAVVKPFWFVRSRKHALSLAGICFVAFGCTGIAASFLRAPALVPDRPSTISEADWKEQMALCEEAKLNVPDCVGNDVALQSARQRVADGRVAEANRQAEAVAAAAREAAQREKEAAATAEREAARQERASALQDEMWAATTKDAVRRGLRNPSSAVFRNVNVYRPLPDRDTPVVCGEVNSENGFGGMSGFQGFIGSGSGENFPVILEEQMADGEYVKAFQQLCKNLPK